MVRTIRTFNNVRSLLFRTKTGTRHEGWAIHLGQSAARIRLSHFVGMEVGESVEGECYGDGTLVRFAGRVAGQAGQEIVVGIVGSLSFEPSRDELRLQVDNLAGRIGDGAHDASLAVLDVSPKGLRGLVDFSFAPMSTLRLALSLPKSRFEAMAKLASCRMAEAGYYHAELQFVDVSRLDAATWQSFIEECAQA